ncbi:unnamed protein product, partial [Didymodactylos carnosus]
MYAMIDTGATHTLITEKAIRSTHHSKFIRTTLQQLYQADGYTPLPHLGLVELTIQIRNIATKILAFVVKRLCTDCLLGNDYLKKYKVKIDNGTNTVSIRLNNIETSIPMEETPASFRLPVTLVNHIYIPPHTHTSVK